MGTADFRIGKPITITDAKLVSSSVPETTVTEYAAGTTYAIGDIRGVTTGTAQDVYQSLQGGNTGNAPATSPTWWKFLGRVYASYASGTAYALNDIVTDLPNHQLYQSNIAANSGNPLTDKSKWIPLGATNRRKMFDKVVNSQTVAPESVSVTLAPGEVVNTLLLLNLAGSQVTVAQSDSGYTRTRSLVRHNVLSWYDFYYQLPIRAGDAVFSDIPPYPASTLTITVDNPGADAAIGCCFLGRPFFVGTTQWEFEGGILSYSTSNEDTFGNVTMVRRPNAKTLRFDVAIPRGYEDEAYRILRDHTDVEVFIIGTDNFAMSFSYGFLGDWRVPASIKGKTAPIEFKGLI